MISDTLLHRKPVSYAILVRPATSSFCNLVVCVKYELAIVATEFWKMILLILTDALPPVPDFNVSVPLFSPAAFPER